MVQTGGRYCLEGNETYGIQERVSGDCTRFSMRCYGEEPKAMKRRDQGSLGRNKHGEIESYIYTGGWLALVWPSPVLDHPRPVGTTCSVLLLAGSGGRSWGNPAYFH